MVEEWQKRTHFKEDSKLKSLNTVLKYITGRKNGRPCVKVFLKNDDKEEENKKVEKFFREKGKYLSNQADTDFEMISIEKESEQMWDEVQEIEKREEKAPEIPESTRDILEEIINSEGDKIYSRYSNVVGIGISNVLTRNGSIDDIPCIVLYCLDKDIVPFGEKPLPKYVMGYPCDIRKEIMIFGGACDNCQIVNPGCDIRSNFFSGSAGFLVNMKNCAKDATGFLTAAHVVVEDVGLIYKDKSENFSRTRHLGDIMHPSNSLMKVGEVQNCFFGNFQSTGSDIAIVCIVPPSLRPGGKQI